jgi:RHS repeat-associated protein
MMQWNFQDELQAVARQAVNNGTPETTYYVYDSSGQRVRKVTENQADSGATPTQKEERLYLGGVEIYINHTGANAGLERQSLHISDDSGHIAMVDTRNEVDEDTEIRTIRYQMSNHLGSVALETNETGEVISYEEYHPYGTIAYQAVSADIRTAAKRYRYTGKEQDEETGLYYHGARYYACWLGRWISSDPAGIIDGVNLFRYARNNPLRFHDKSGKAPSSPEDPPDPFEDLRNKAFQTEDKIFKTAKKVKKIEESIDKLGKKGSRDDINKLKKMLRCYTRYWRARAFFLPINCPL